MFSWPEETAVACHGVMQESKGVEPAVWSTILFLLTLLIPLVSTSSIPFLRLISGGKRQAWRGWNGYSPTKMEGPFAGNSRQQRETCHWNHDYTSLQNEDPRVGISPPQSPCPHHTIPTVSSPQSPCPHHTLWTSRECVCYTEEVPQWWGAGRGRGQAMTAFTHRISSLYVLKSMCQSGQRNYCPDSMPQDLVAWHRMLPLF